MVKECPVYKAFRLPNSSHPLVFQGRTPATGDFQECLVHLVNNNSSQANLEVLLDNSNLRLGSNRVRLETHLIHLDRARVNRVKAKDSLTPQ